MRSILSAEERAEYDALMEAATHNEDGSLVPSRLIAGRVQALMVDAEKAGRRWAEIESERALLAGYRAEAARYLRRTNTATVTDLTGSKSRTAVYSVREERASGGEWQPKLLVDFTPADLAALIQASVAQITAYVANRDAAERLRDKVLSTKSGTVREALGKLGVSLDEALAA